MKKTFLASLFIFLILTSLKSQNWRTINSQRTSYFRMINELYGLKPDSFLVDTKDTIFYPYSIRKTNFSSVEPSWAGKKIIVKENGWDLYFSNSDDTIFINTKAEENDNWKFFKEKNGNYYWASLIKKSKEDLGGMEDSVKLFTLQYKDQNDQPLTSDLNNYPFKFSKNNGLVLCSYLLNFPAFTDSLKLVGVDSLFGVQNIKEREIYNFDVGDIFHYYREDVIGLTYQHIQIDTIIGKSITSDLDSVKYTIKRSIYNHDYVFPVNAPHQYFINHYTPDYYIATDNYLLINNKSFLNDPPLIWHSSVFPSYFWHNDHYAGRSYYDSDLNSRLVRYYISQDGFVYTEEKLGDGVGTIYKDNRWENGISEFSQLLYYKKTNETWGKPIKGDSLLALSITNGIDISNEVTVSPNPFSESCYIHFENAKSSSITCILTDLSGKEVKRFSTNFDHIIIGKENLNKGVYLLKINDEEGRYANKKLIID